VPVAGYDVGGYNVAGAKAFGDALEVGFPRFAQAELIPGFSAAQSVAIDGRFRRKIIEAEKTKNPELLASLDAELIKAGLHDRYVRTRGSSDVPGSDAESGVPGRIGSTAVGAQSPIPGWSIEDSAATDGYFRRRIRAAWKSADARLLASVDDELTERGLHDRYVREHDPRGTPVHPISGRAGEVGSRMPFRPERIPAYSPAESTKVDGYFRRRIREAEGSKDAALAAQVETELRANGLEHRYHRAGADLEAGEQGGGGIGGVMEGRAFPITGYSPKDSTRTDAYFWQKIKKSHDSQDRALVAAVTKELRAKGLERRYRRAMYDGEALFWNPDHARIGTVAAGQRRVIAGLAAQESAKKDAYFREKLLGALVFHEWSDGRKELREVDAELATQGLTKRYWRENATSPL
jgi:hypothetical protein